MEWLLMSLGNVDVMDHDVTVSHVDSLFVIASHLYKYSRTALKFSSAEHITMSNIDRL